MAGIGAWLYQGECGQETAREEDWREDYFWSTIEHN